MKAIKDTERTRCEIWTRVMGYHRPVTEFNIGKYQEFKDRNFLKENKIHYCEKDKKISA